MSIRLRLALLYTVILAVTLASLGAILYGTQYRSMLSDGGSMLRDISQRLVERREQGEDPIAEQWPALPRPRDTPPEPRQLNASRALYVQITSADAEIVMRSESLGELELPLNGAGRQAVLGGATWQETARIGGEKLLIYSAPVRSHGETTEILQVALSLAEQDQYLATMQRNLLVGSGIAILIAFGSGWLLAGVVLQPINRITQTAQEIGAQRDFGRRVSQTGPNDEIGRLATTFNGMLTELEAAYQQQQQFVADVSHELRTPLTTLRGNLDLLGRQPPIRSEDREEVLSDMVDESQRLIRLVNDLLVLARADAWRHVRRDGIEIRPLVADICRQARLLDPERPITCEALPDVTIVGDQDTLKQILLVLVDNALKHSSGAITFNAAVVDGSVAISVRDMGPGIRHEELPHIFERFYRGRGSPPESGIGLGLAIAKALVEAQGGAISVESQVEQGSTFTVTLPLG